MSRLGSSRLFAAVVGLVALASVAPAEAQNPEPAQAPVRIGPLALAPTFRLTNVGHDDNVFNVNADNNPTSDVTAQATPIVEGWLRTPRVRATGRGQFDYFYYRQLTNLRSLDTDAVARVELLVNRFTPYVEGSLLNSRHQNGYEIDIYARRRDDSARGGVVIRLTPKTSFDVYTRRFRSAYESDAVPGSTDLVHALSSTDLAHALNRTGTIAGLGVAYKLTPLTTLGLFVEQEQDRFEFSSSRDTNSYRVMPTVEFNPRALISGRASIGFRRVEFPSGSAPEFQSSVATVDLIYHVRARTDVAIGVRRDLDYSYLDTQSDYVSTGVATTVTQRIGAGWDLRGTLGRYRLGYQRRAIGGLTTDFPSETGINYGMEVGYELGRTRIGFNVDHYERDSDAAVGRVYNRLRVATSATYAFQTRR